MFEIEIFICIKMDLAVNNQQKLIFHKTLTSNMYVDFRFADTSSTKDQAHKTQL